MFDVFFRYDDDFLSKFSFFFSLSVSLSLFKNVKKGKKEGRKKEENNVTKKPMKIHDRNDGSRYRTPGLVASPPPYLSSSSSSLSSFLSVVTAINDYLRDESSMYNCNTIIETNRFARVIILGRY